MGGWYENEIIVEGNDPLIYRFPWHTGLNRGHCRPGQLSNIVEWIYKENIFL